MGYLNQRGKQGLPFLHILSYAPPQDDSGTQHKVV